MTQRIVFVMCCGAVLAQTAAPGAALSIGHRGDALFAPENTLASFTSANGKADWTELDARVTADGQFVIMHDSMVDRTTDGTGSVATNTLARLKLLDAGSWFSSSFTGECIPTLEESLQVILPKATPLIERKAGTAAAYVAELRRLNAVSNVVLQSFDWTFLAGVHALEPGIRLCGLGSGALSAASLTTITNAGASMVAWEKAGINADILALAHSYGLALFAWTVDGPEIENYLELGVDGVISNDPGLVKAMQQNNTNSPITLGKGLVSYWRLDDGLTNGMATAVADSKGTNAGTLLRPDGQSHWLIAGLGKFGGGVSLRGTNGCITLPRTSSLDIGTNEVSVALWVKPSQLPSQITESFAGIFDSVEDSYVVYLDRANQELRFKVTTANGDAARPGVPQSRLETNQWIHVAATFSGNSGPASGQAVIYLNGIPQDVHTGSDSLGARMTGSVKIGQVAALGRNGSQASNSFYGGVDDVAVWRRALSPKEIAVLYAHGLEGLSLGDLLREPTTLIQPLSVRREAGDLVRITFRSQGTWRFFKLLRAADLNSPFLPVTGLASVALGGEYYRFDCPTQSGTCEFFRIEGE